MRIDAHCVCLFTQYFCILPPHYTELLISLEEAAVEKERLVTELRYVIFLVLDALDISDGVHE